METPSSHRGTETQRKGTGVRRNGCFALFLLTLLAGFAAASAAQSKKEPPAKPLDLNAATQDELQQLPEVGPKLAEAIVRFRKKAGPFRRVEELLAVPGITKRRLEKIRPHVFVRTEKTK